MKIAHQYPIDRYNGVNVNVIISLNQEAKQLNYGINICNLDKNYCFDPEELKRFATQLTTIADDLLAKEQATKTFLFDNI